MKVLAALVLLVPLLANAQQAREVIPLEGGGGLPTATSSATGVPSSGLLKNLSCVSSGDCTLCDLFAVVSNAVNLLMSLAGAVALGFLLWVAFGLVAARGNAEAIKAGKEGLWRIAVGLFFLLLAWELVFLVLIIMSGGNITKPPWQGISCLPSRTGAPTR